MSSEAGSSTTDLQISETEGNTTWNFNQIQLPNEVFQLVFSFLDLNSLKTARQVCRSWNGNAVEVLKRTTRCILDISNYKKCVELIGTMKSAPDIPFKAFRIEIPTTGARYDKMNEIFTYLGPLLNKLTIHLECCVTSDLVKVSCSSDDLLFLLNKCENLEHLVLSGVSRPNSIEVFTGIDDWKGFNNIKILDIYEIREEPIVLGVGTVEFSMGKIFFPGFTKCMPNVSELIHYFITQYQFEMFMNQLVVCKEKGYLQKLKKIKLEVDFDSTVYCTKNHWKIFTDMNWKLEAIDICGFVFRGCRKIGGEDIPHESFHNFFCDNSESLKRCTFETYEGKIQIRTLHFPMMKNLNYLALTMLGVIDTVKQNDCLSNIFPKLQTLTLDTNWEPELDIAYPCLKNKWTSIVLVIPSQGNKKEEPRQINIQHNTVDYNFLKPDFFGILYKWFPRTKEIYATIKIHFGLLNLLRGLSHTNVEEIHMEVDCDFCQLDEAERESQPKNDYENKFKYQIENCENESPFPELRVLNINAIGCRFMGFLYIYNSDVMKLITAAPKLHNFTIVGNYGDICGNVVTKYSKCKMATFM